MLHKTKKTNSSWKVAIAFPLLLAFMLVFNVKTEAQIKTVKSVKVSNVEWNPDSMVSVLITPSTAKETLLDFTKKFEEYGVILQFKDLKYSKEGLIKGIKVKYINKKNKESGKFNKLNDMPIDDFIITLLEDGKITFNSPNLGTVKPEYLEDTKDVVLDSISYDSLNSKRRFKNIPANKIIITKPSQKIQDNSFSLGTNSDYYPNSDNSTESNSTLKNFSSNNGNPITWAQNDSLSSKYSSKTSDTLKVYKIESRSNKTSNISSIQEKGFLIILNGKEMPEGYDVNKIAPESIQQVNVLKGKAAVKTYGNKAKEGAIEITTKKEGIYPKIE